MNIIQKKLVEAYATLVMANQTDPTKGIPIEQVPETKVISGVEYPIRSEVEIEIARRTIEAIG